MPELGAHGTASGGPSATVSASAGAGNGPFVTRLHVRYDAKSFPEDLNFIETGDRENFQGRYVLHHPSRGRKLPGRQSLPRLAPGAVQEGGRESGQRSQAGRKRTSTARMAAAGINYTCAVSHRDAAVGRHTDACATPALAFSASPAAS